ncbi:glycosyltransferase [Photobacterium leiognathi]|uniref:glycosyltransferase n=1 Tax=Photobacterium leiognathi TaxID=553611 RepID=UPI002982A8F9|nr:glycosyltransferase [Photobacterium leiognathi]
MKKILIVGVPFYAKKYGYLLESYLKADVEPKMLLNMEDDKNNNNEFKEYINYAGKKPLKRVLRYISVLREFKPLNIDCYDYSILSILYVLIARGLGINVRFWLIGGELRGDKSHFNKDSKLRTILTKIKMVLTKLCLLLSNTILAKEEHHVDSIKKINKKLSNKVIPFYNCVPVSERFTIRDFNSEHGCFLYANAVVESRNVYELIDSFFTLKSKNIHFTASIYGFNSISNEVYDGRGIGYSEKVLKHHKACKLDGLVNTHGFVSNITEVMKNYRFFVLPSDYILANYALLEAMSIGLVPIIYPGNGYEKIIIDGVNGIVVKDNKLDAALIRALNLTNDEYNRMSYMAHNKVLTDFSLATWPAKLSLNLN